MLLGAMTAAAAVRTPGGAPVFDPATLPLSIWTPASYGGVPWVGAASAGGSGARDLTSPVPPAVGAALNGLTPADCNGSTERLLNGTAISSLLSAAAWSFAALVDIDAISTNATTSVWLNDPIAIDSGAFWGITLRDSGVVQRVIAYQWDGAEKFAEAAIVTGGPALVQARFDGANIQVRVNSGAWSSAPTGNIQVVTGTLVVGTNQGLSDWFDGRIYELMLAPSSFSDVTFDNLKNYFNNRYGLSL